MIKPSKQQLASIKPVQVHTLYDIRKAIANFMPHDVPKSTVKGKINGIEVTAPIDCDYYSQFFNGMTALKVRQETIDRLGDNARKVLNIDAPTWVDNLIKTRLGGTREGLRVKWVLGPDMIYFDPFTGQLSKCCTPQLTSS